MDIENNKKSAATKASVLAKKLTLTDSYASVAEGLEDVKEHFIPANSCWKKSRKDCR